MNKTETPKKRPVVYVVQEPMKKDPVTQRMVTKFNFAKAAAYGEIKMCLPTGPVALCAAPTIFQLNEVLANFCDDDYIIAAGDPSAIMMVGAVLANKNRGRFKLLKYDQEARNYIQVDVNIFQRLGDAQAA